MKQIHARMLVGLLAAGALTGLAACGGGGSSGGGGGPVGPTPTPVPPGGPQVYLTEASGSSSSSQLAANTILAFSIAGILGGQSVAPSLVIQSPAFLNIPAIAVDGVKNIYTVDQPSATLYEFPAGSTGSGVSPSRTITSSAFNAPYGVAIGPLGGIYVTDPMGGPLGTGAIDVFSASQNGNVTPIRQIAGAASQLNQPYGVAVDSSSDVWVTNDSGASSSPSSVMEFAPSGSKPIRVISGNATGLNAPIAIALDSSGNIYVANEQGNSVTVYGPNANGNQAPTRVLSGSSTGIVLPEGLAFDLSGNIFVSNLQLQGVSGTLNVFPPNSTGNVAPIAELSGSSSVTFNPVGVAI
jgi:hypothetical protein